MIFNETGHAIYLLRNIEVLSSNYCCNGKTTGIKYYKCLYSCMFSALYYIVVPGLSGSTIFFRVINRMIFEINYRM